MTSTDPGEDHSRRPGYGPPPPERTTGLISAFRRTGYSLRHRNYRLFFAGHTISMIGVWAQRVAVGWLVWELTGSKIWLGILGAVGPLPMTFLSTLGGLVAERVDRRRILYATQSLAALTPCVMAVVLLMDRNLEFVRPWHLLVVVVINGAIMAFDVPARQAFVVKMVGPRDIANAIGLNSVIFNFSRMTGALVGAGLFGALGAAACFGLNGVTYLALVGALLMMRLPPPSELQRRRARMSRHPLGGFYYVWNHRPIRGTMILLAAAAILGWSFATLLPAFADEVFHGGSGTYSVFVAVIGAGALTGALLMAYLGYYRKRQRLILIGVALFVASIGTFTLVKHYWPAMIALYFGGLGLLICMSGINSFIQLAVSERFRGRVMCCSEE
ncbi:MAG: MFS transporter [Anaerolineaceae bacterium]|nr:MFS transporter [Anaerolineaceae bacterium]